MLSWHRRELGFNLIELMVAIAVFSILIVVGLPSFNTWLQNSQIRVAAEALQNGVQLARAEAVRRNTPVRFQLVSTLDDTCALSNSGTNWVVSIDSAVSACATDTWDEVATVPPLAARILQKRPGAEGSANAVVAANQSEIRFNALGRIIPVPAASITFDVTNPAGGTCAVAGPMRCLRVVVTTGGQVRMCDPALPGTDSQGC